MLGLQAHAVIAGFIFLNVGTEEVNPCPQTVQQALPAPASLLFKKSPK